VTSAGGCKDTFTANSLVNIGNLSAGFTPSTTTPCTGSGVLFTNTTTPGAGGSSWDFGDGTTSALNNPTHAYTTPGTYTVTLIAINSNGSDTLTLNNYITVYPYPPPQGILQSGDTLFANAGAVAYQWYYNGNIINGATGYYYVATQNGNYNVICTDNNGCEVEAAIFDVMTDIGELTQDGIEIYPVPAKNFLNINTGKLHVDQVELYNNLGEIVLSSSPSPSGEGWASPSASLWRPKGEGIEVNISNLPSGIYFVVVSSEEKKFRSRIIKL
jgi:hypothetical protein